MPLTQAQKDAIAPHVAAAKAAGRATAADVAAYLNTPRAIANPVAAPMVPVEMHETYLGGLLTDATNDSLRKLLLFVNFGFVKADVERQNNLGIAAWAAKLEYLGIVTTAEKLAIQQYATTPVPDPDWPATVVVSPWVQAFGLAPFDLPGGGSIGGTARPELVAEVI